MSEAYAGRGAIRYDGAAAARGAADVFIAPALDGVEIRDWRAFEPAVEAGYRAATRALESLDCPLTELRLRRSGAV